MKKIKKTTMFVLSALCATYAIMVNAEGEETQSLFYSNVEALSTENYIDPNIAYDRYLHDYKDKYGATYKSCCELRYKDECDYGMQYNCNM